MFVLQRFLLHLSFKTFWNLSTYSNRYICSGMLYDKTNSWNSSFILASCCFFLGFLSLFAEPYAKKIMEKRETKEPTKRKNKNENEYVDVTQSQTINILKNEMVWSGRQLTFICTLLTFRVEQFLLFDCFLNVCRSDTKSTFEAKPSKLLVKLKT